MLSQHRQRPYRGWGLVWALGLTTIVSYGTTQYFFVVLVVPVQHELGWSRALISGAFSLSLVTSGLFGLPIGRLVDRHGARVLMSLGSILGIPKTWGCSRMAWPDRRTGRSARPRRQVPSFARPLDLRRSGR